MLVVDEVPKNVLYAPDVNPLPEELPIAVLLDPVVLFCMLALPNAVFDEPDKFDFMESIPIAVLYLPEILVFNALAPIVVFSEPVVLLCNALYPTAVLLSALLDSNTLEPTAVFLLPLLLIFNAFAPTAVLFEPDVFDANVRLPIALLYAPTPITLDCREDSPILTLNPPLPPPIFTLLPRVESLSSITSSPINTRFENEVSPVKSSWFTVNLPPITAFPFIETSPDTNKRFFIVASSITLIRPFKDKSSAMITV